jgi:hypothetical protein
VCIYKAKKNIIIINGDGACDLKDTVKINYLLKI